LHATEIIAAAKRLFAAYVKQSTNIRKLLINNEILLTKLNNTLHLMPSNIPPIGRYFAMGSMQNVARAKSHPDLFGTHTRLFFVPTIELEERKA